MQACRAVLQQGSGPVLLTGEAGVGKTWLARRLAAEGPSPSPPRWVVVDITRSTDPAGFLRTVAHGLGLDASGHESALRLDLADALTEWSADGRRRALIVDEAHLASGEVLDEVRVLSNRLGRPDGLDALILLGQTPLARRVETHPLAALEARLAARIHLRPIDADEARLLVSRLIPEAGRDATDVERWHRDAGGNPRRLLRLAALDPMITARRILAEAETQPQSPAPVGPPSPAVTPTPAPVDSPASSPPRLGPARPPIRVEDNLIEVGWEADPEPSGAPVVAAVEGPEPSPPEAPAEESVEDHYAALQAWNEWARNQDRNPADLVAEATAPEEHAQPTEGAANVWVEGQQTFAPYSQLFSRLRPSKDKG
jgi:general secretion pathway protein A